MLTATGLSEASTFDSWNFGPRLVVACCWSLRTHEMHKVSMHALHEMPDGTMRWEEVDTLGEYSVFVDCAGRSAIACADAAGCGDVAGNCIYFAEMTFYHGDSQRY